jgi:hypothetical protein
MNYTEENNNISRAKFLKASGLMAAGLALLPGFASSMAAGKGLGDYQIIMPENATEVEKQAAELLGKYLSEISGSTMSPLAEADAKGTNTIYIGQTNYAKAQGVDAGKIAEGGYQYKSVGNNLIIAGGTKKGILYGVDDLLESIGVKKFAPDYTFVPKGKAVSFANADKMYAPMIKYRTCSYSSMGDQNYSDWHKLSSRQDWGLFVHTFGTLMPPKEYGKTHPEYYSLIKGIRSPGTQLCLSNEEVATVLIENLKKKIAEKPLPTYWSVSQDDNDQYCQCDNCKALNEKYGGVPSGSVIYFVNKVAKAIPDKMISTLAYWYTRKAAKNIKAEPNVNIMLCNIESRRNAPVFDTDPAFSADLKDWGAMASDIIIWDYNIQFTNFFGPFPNLYTLKPNIKFYTDNQVKALFMQSNAEPAAEMALLRSYMIYKLMWDPSLDDKAIVDEFVNGYFGAGGPYIRQYVDSMHQSMVQSGIKLNIFGDPIDAKEGYLSTAMMAQYNQLFDKAEAAVKSNPDQLLRVQVARLPIMYAAIQIGRTEIDTPRSMYKRTATGSVIGKPEMKALVSKFVEGCQKKDVKLVRERAGSPEHFLAAYTRIFDNMALTDKTKSFKKKITSITTPDPKSKGVEALTDGVFASYEAWQSADQNWVFYTGQHMDFVLDLGAVVPVNTVNMDFLNPQAQPDWHLFSLPKFVTYSVSADGQTYSDPVQIDNSNNPNPIDNPGISKIPIMAFKTDMKPGSKARYIKVHAESLLKMPSWHIRSGQPASIYTDQIVVT